MVRDLFDPGKEWIEVPLNTYVRALNVPRLHLETENPRYWILRVPVQP